MTLIAPEGATWVLLRHSADFPLGSPMGPRLAFKGGGASRPDPTPGVSNPQLPSCGLDAPAIFGKGYPCVLYAPGPTGQAPGQSCPSCLAHLNGFIEKPNGLLAPIRLPRGPFAKLTKRV